MNDALAMRASDRDREQLVDQLRTALEDGRLTTDEYVDRVGLAYQARTYGELAPLQADLPRVICAPASDTPDLVTPAAGPISRLHPLASLPVLLRVLWAIWLAAVSINVVVWALVGVSSGILPYPWPLWVAGPYGAALFAISAVVKLSRKPSKP